MGLWGLTEYRYMVMIQWLVKYLSIINTNWFKMTLTPVAHHWSVHSPLSKLILPVPGPLSGMDEVWLEQRVNGRESPYFVCSTGHRVEMHSWAAAAAKGSKEQK